ncbi:MAG: PLP-dependent aminotransferase family protein, partial [Chloroflexota bacterium]|nr:PLP-dependent aminotransferase family protein [Chloroflexota bacterium]
PALRFQLAALLHEQGIDVFPDEIVVTNGVTQGLALVVQTLAKPGDRVLVEAPTYLGFLNLLQAQGLQPVAVPVDEEGARLDELERLIQVHRPRLYYTIPTFHNPTGYCMPTGRRRDLLRLAEAYDLLLVEDDLYRPLAYDDPPPAPLKQLDASERVVYLSSFSKTLFPGIRVGYLVAPRALYGQLTHRMRATSLCGPSLLQRALAIFLENGAFHRHLQRVLPHYRTRRDALLDALDAYMPDGAQWSTPQGGFCCWITLPGNHPFDDLHYAALQAGVAFAPGEVFFPHTDNKRHLRLCFGKETPETIRVAVERLATLVRERITGERQSTYASVAWSPLV